MREKLVIVGTVEGERELYFTKLSNSFIHHRLKKDSNKKLWKTSFLLLSFLRLILKHEIKKIKNRGRKWWKEKIIMESL